ncbi:MAG: VWA domain-containing protein [Pyrinomonadaceae bacterium]
MSETADFFFCFDGFLIMMTKMKLRLKIPILLLLLLFAAANIATAQNEPDDAPIKVDTLLYTIPLTVSDKNGHAVSGLKKEDFTVYQDNVLQQIEFFFNEESPMNVAVLIDTSGSTKPVLDKIQKAARDFLKVLRPEDKGVIVSFDYRTKFLSDLTSDRKQLSEAVSRASIAARDGSDMNDAVFKVINNYFAAIKGRKAIIVLTDGITSGREIPNYQVLNLLRKSDTLLYPIVFKTSLYYVKDSNAPNAAVHFPYEPLEQMAEESAGRFYIKDANDLKEAFQNISEDLKKQYLIGYYPQNTRRPPDSVKINVDREDMKINVKKTRIFER